MITIHWLVLILIIVISGGIGVFTAALASAAGKDKRVG